VSWICDDGSRAQEAYFVVDTMYGQLPQLAKDIFWDQDVVDLPVTQATHAYRKVNFDGSAAGIRYDHSSMPYSDDDICLLVKTTNDKRKC